jgi:hypothetical protein
MLFTSVHAATTDDKTYTHTQQDASFVSRRRRRLETYHQEERHQCQTGHTPTKPNNFAICLIKLRLEYVRPINYETHNKDNCQILEDCVYWYAQELLFNGKSA